MTIEDKLVKCLEGLKENKYINGTVARVGNAKTEKALNLIFEISRKPTNFTEGEKRQIGNLLVDVFKPIRINIESTYLKSRNRLDSSVLKKRSVLQYLVEDFGQFPARNSTLREELERLNIQESIEILDDIINKWRYFTDSDEGQTDPEEDMPETHTWWPSPQQEFSLNKLRLSLTSHPKKSPIIKEFSSKVRKVKKVSRKRLDVQSKCVKTKFLKKITNFSSSKGPVLIFKTSYVYSLGFLFLFWFFFVVLTFTRAVILTLQSRKLVE